MLTRRTVLQGLMGLMLPRPACADRLYFFRATERVSDGRLREIDAVTRTRYLEAGIRFSGGGLVREFPRLSGLDILLFAADAERFPMLWSEYGIDREPLWTEPRLNAYDLLQDWTGFPYPEEIAANHAGVIVYRQGKDLANAAAHEVGHGLGAMHVFCDHPPPHHVRLMNPSTMYEPDAALDAASAKRMRDFIAVSRGMPAALMREHRSRLLQKPVLCQRVTR